MSALRQTSDLVDVAEQISRIILDAERTGLSQLVQFIASAQETHAHRPASYGRQRWRKALREVVGSNAQLIANLLPELELLVGKQLSRLEDIVPQ
jgi:predicted ATPase